MPIAPPIIDSTDAQAAFNRVEASLADVPDADLLIVNTDLDKSGKAAFALAQRCVVPEIWEQLALQPPTQFDAARQVPLLADLGLAASWVATRGLSVRAGASDVQLPQLLVQDCMATRGRMFSTAEYCLDDNPLVMVELASIKSGQGYDDVKHDLRRLGLVYQEQAAELSGKKYDPADADKAFALADEIHLRQKHNMTADQQLLERRLWTRLKATGDRVFEAAYYVTYHQPALRATLRSIHSWRDGRRWAAPSEVAPLGAPEAQS